MQVKRYLSGDEGEVAGVAAIATAAPVGEPDGVRESLAMPRASTSATVRAASLSS